MRRFVIAVTTFCCLWLGSVACASAASPWWGLNSSVRPATIPTGGEGTIVAVASNLGNAETSGPSTVSLTLPPKVSVVEEGGVPQIQFQSLEAGKVENFAPLHCTVTGGSVTCGTAPTSTAVKKILEEFGLPNKPPWPELIEEIFSIASLAPYEFLEVRVRVKDEGAGSGATFTAETSGGGAVSPFHSTRPFPIGSGAPEFGAEDYELRPEAQGGGLDSRAGAHPYQVTATFNLNQDAEDTTNPTNPKVQAPRMARNLAFALPPGMIGNAQAVAQCTIDDFNGLAQGGFENFCPSASVIGVASITFYEPAKFGVGLSTYAIPLFNLTPAFGEPARFGFEFLHIPIILDTSVRSDPGEDYGVTVSTHNITQLSNFMSSTTTFWGTPGDPSHDISRNWPCLAKGHWTQSGRKLPCQPLGQERPAAFLTLPTDCNAPFAPGVSGESWTDPEHPTPATFGPFAYSLEEGGVPQALTACNQLPFAPAMQAEPSTDKASAPSGLDFNLNFDDEGLTSATGRTQSQLKNTTVTLPEGFTINPSAGVGLGGCTTADYERESVNSAPGAGCPNNSKLGTVEIESPLLAQKIHGSLYIAQPYENPFGEPEHGHPGGTFVAIYIVAKNPETGILVKLAGKVTPNPVTGQLTTSFLNNPQLPFDHFNFHFREGAQAPLITPATCGSYTVNAQLTPWSNPTTTLTDTSSFTITKGYDGGACPSGGVPPFNPGIAAGTLNNNGGAFSPFYLHLTRTDGEQEISGFSTNMPAGLTGDLTGIPFCPEANIETARQKTGAQEEASPSCPASTQIGHTLVGTGVGAVLAYVPGKVYFAGPFHGAPFSIVSVTSAVVGPFDLGTVVLRFGLSIDPNTAQVSVSPTSSEPIPTIIDGIVTHVRDIRVYIDRPNFILNPTSCNPLSISSTLNSDLGYSATVSSPFQDANCANLTFKPAFKVSTSAKTSRRNGASLYVKLTYPAGALGKDANIRSVKVDLPKQLPSRLTTLQKACTATQFNTNPAGCPSASKVGYAKAITPLIPEPLQGPAYFVSHGGEEFPNLIIVLQGYGVTIHLIGDTFINEHTNITSSTFKTIPDQPVGSFELTLPQGPNSALAAPGNLCTVKGGLKMPTLFTAQNGATIKRSTPIAVTGCQKSHKKAKKKRKKH